MANTYGTYGQAAADLGMGGEGDMLSAQMSEEEKLRRKKLLQGAGQADPTGANAMGMAAMQLLGGFRG